MLARAATHQYDKLIASATQAVRQASDGEEFARQAGDAIGTPVRIVSAQREAELSFLGVASRHAAKREWVMVDLGGASTEVAIGRGRELVRSNTLTIGSGVLASTFLADPPRPEERARLRKAALRELAQAPDGDVEKPGASLALMHPVRDRAQFLRAASPPVSLVEWVDHTAKTEPESPVFQMRGFGNSPVLIARVAPRYPDSAGSRPAASSS